MEEGGRTGAARTKRLAHAHAPHHTHTLTCMPPPPPTRTCKLALLGLYSLTHACPPRLLIDRNFTSYWRSPNYNLIRMLTTIGFGLIFGTLYYKLGSDR